MVCKDGTALSIQVGESLYCEPRENKGPYTLMEVGLMSGVFILKEEWEHYRDGDSFVYGYVPVSLIQRELDLHGGIDVARTFVEALGYERKMR